jgi:transcriptional regulator with XRE-family HTH domain
MKNMDQFGVTEGGLLSDAKLSRYENGLENLEFDTIASIALGLGVDILELFYYD